MTHTQIIKYLVAIGYKSLGLTASFRRQLHLLILIEVVSALTKAETFRFNEAKEPSLSRKQLSN